MCFADGASDSGIEDEKSSPRKVSVFVGEQFNTTKGTHKRYSVASRAGHFGKCISSQGSEQTVRASACWKQLQVSKRTGPSCQILDAFYEGTWAYLSVSQKQTASLFAPLFRVLLTAIQANMCQNNGTLSHADKHWLFQELDLD